MRALGREPVHQLFCGEDLLPSVSVRRSSRRAGASAWGGQLVGAIEESLAVATWMGAAKPADFGRWPSHDRAGEGDRLPMDEAHASRTRSAWRASPSEGVTLRQSYARVVSIALIRTRHADANS